MKEQSPIVKVGNTFDAVWKILFVFIFLGGAVANGTLAWMRIQENTKDIELVKAQLDKLATQQSVNDLKDQVTKQYTNLKDLDTKINANAKAEDDRADALEKNAYYQQGYDEAAKELKHSK